MRGKQRKVVNGLAHIRLASKTPEHSAECPGIVRQAEYEQVHQPLSSGMPRISGEIAIIRQNIIWKRCQQALVQKSGPRAGTNRSAVFATSRWGNYRSGSLSTFARSVTATGTKLKKFQRVA